MATTPNPSLVEFRNLSFSYGDHMVLDKISLRIPKGKVTALIGPMGANFVQPVVSRCRMRPIFWHCPMWCAWEAPGWCLRTLWCKATGRVSRSSRATP